MNKPDATVSVGADGSAFSKAMQDMAKNTDTMANSITARLARLGQAFQGLATIGNITGGSLAALTRPAAELENTAAAIAVMTGSAEDAEELATQLQLMAANGVRGMDELYRAARALTNVYSDTGNIEHWVGVLADIAAATKIPTDRLAEMVARFRDMGKAEFTELANAGVPIFEALARATGKSKEEVIKLQSVVGGITFDQLLAALQSLTVEGGKYHQMNATLSNTTQGSFDTLKASIEACAAVLGKPINDTLRPILQELSGQLQELRPEMEEIAGAFGKFLSGAAKMATPLISALGHIAGLFTSTERVVSYAAAALLVYAAHANRAAAATMNFGTMIASATTRLKALRLGSIFSGWGGIINGAKRTWAGFTGFMATSWKSVCISLAVTFKAAMVAVKAALISTGIGALIWAIGEGLSAVYQYFAGVDEEAQAAERSGRQFERTLRGLKKQAAGVRTEMDIENTLERARELAEDLREEEAQAREDENEVAERSARSQRRALEAWMTRAEQEMQMTVRKVQAEEERTRQMREQARLAEEAAREEERRLRTIEQMRKARMDADFEREMDALRDIPEGLSGGESGVVRSRLRRVGAPNEEALYAERDRLERLYHPTEEQLERYKELTETIAKIEEEHRKAEEAAAAHQEENRKRRDNYYDRKSTYNQNRADEAYEKKSIRGQERQLRRDAQAAGYWGEMNPDKIREHLDELARTGAKDNEDRIAALERILQLHDELVKRKQRYQQQRATDMQELRIQALELAGRKRAADALRDELELQQRITELRERGATKKQATEQATMEAKMREAAEQRARIQAARVEFIQGFQANVGGGGASFRLGNSQLQESKKHGRLLKEIRDYLRGQRNTASGVAVLA
ncbi:MAG: hypothetical protein IJW85_11695 [Clostridia bacterium]|nr:hypothetical protein [Clostridia bacterium]